MTFDEWWATKGIKITYTPCTLRDALKELAYEAWCESRYQQNLTSRSSRAARCYPEQPEHIFNQHGLCMLCGKLIDPPPA